MSGTRVFGGGEGDFEGKAGTAVVFFQVLDGAVHGGCQFADDVEAEAG